MSGIIRFLDKFRKFIVFGLVKGFIHRIHRFPIFHASHSKPVDSKNAMQGLMNKLKKYLNCSFKKLDSWMENIIMMTCVHGLVAAHESLMKY